MPLESRWSSEPQAPASPEPLTPGRRRQKEDHAAYVQRHIDARSALKENVQQKASSETGGVASQGPTAEDIDALAASLSNLQTLRTDDTVGAGGIDFEQHVPAPKKDTVSPLTESAKPQQPSLTESKYASNVSRPAKIPQTVGLFVKGDPSLKTQLQQARRPNPPKSLVRQTPAPVASNIKYKGRGQMKYGQSSQANGFTSRAPAPPSQSSTGQLRGQALIEAQNRAALKRHGGTARGGDLQNLLDKRGPGNLQKPVEAAPGDKRFDGLEGPSHIKPEHLKLDQTIQSTNGRTMADVFKSAQVGQTDPTKDQRDVVYFDRWATPERRRGPAPQIRRVLLKNLGTQCSLRDIASLVWGGDIEQIRYKEGDTYASVLFVNARRCAKYHEDTSNGIEWKNRTIWVELHDQVEPLVGLRLQLINGGHTRCVRATNVEDSILPGALYKVGKDSKALEHMTIAHPMPKRKDVTWRFASIDAATDFKSGLAKDIRFSKPCQISFIEDPCAKAEGVHD